MPTYAYHCRACEKDFEAKQRFSDDPLTECIICEAEDAVFRVIQPAGIVFKGSGWYVTDSRGSGGNGAKSSTATTTTKNETSESENGSSGSDDSSSSSNGATASTESSDTTTKSTKSSTESTSPKDGANTKRAASA
jgi:putative FmdB family regulatory protein